MPTGWTEHRLLIALGLLAASVGLYEVSLSPEIAPLDRELRAFSALAEVYPDSARTHYYRGLDLLNAGRHTEAAAAFSAAFDGGYRDQERFYAAYIDVLMVTEPDASRIGEILDRWRIEHPRSARRLDMERRLHETGVLRTGSS